MKVWWLEQVEADRPPELNWLSAAEFERLHGLRVPKRRADWLLGRWTAKCAVAAYLSLHNAPDVLARIEIRAAPDGAPEAWVAAEPAPVAISLSHKCGVAVCAVAPPGVALGCDLERIEPRGGGFLSDYFTAAEQAYVAHAPECDRPLLTTLLWSAKESALKALRTGLRSDTRDVDVRTGEICNGNWHPLRVACVSGEIFHGWWSRSGSLVRALVAAPPVPAPIFISVRAIQQRAGAATPASAI